MEPLRLTAQQRFRLRKQLATTHDLSTFQHTLALLQVDRGQSTADVAQMLGVSRRSVELWVHDYVRDPVPRVLIPEHSPGRPTLWTEDLQAILRAALHQSPQHWGYQAVNWTVPLLRQHLTHWYHPKLSDDTIRRQLHEWGYVWKRPRYVLEPDPLRASKKRRILQQVNELPHRTVVLFEDETDLLLFPP